MSGQDQLGLPSDPQSWRDRRKRRIQACGAAWQAFPDLEGTHLTVRLIGCGWAIATRDEGNMLATINEGKGAWRLASPRSVRKVDNASRKFYKEQKVMGLEYAVQQVDEVRILDGPLYRRRRLGSRIRGKWGFVDNASGQPVVEVVGGHIDRRAWGKVRLLSPLSARAVGPQTWRFPVEETSHENAVMTAVDHLGKTMMRFRRGSAIADGVDILFSPGLNPTSELLLIAAVGSSWINTYFRIPTSVTIF